MFKQGYRAYFTGPGLNAYKLRWTEQTQENKMINLCNSGVRGRYHWWMEGNIIPVLRNLRDRAFQWWNKFPSEPAK
jgi:hypothetical protein